MVKLKNVKQFTLARNRRLLSSSTGYYLLSKKKVKIRMYDGRARNQNLRILIVEGNSVAGSNLWLLVSELGYHAQWVMDGESAIRAAAAFEPHLILVNVVLPGITGYDAASRIRSEAPSNLLKVVGIVGQYHAKGGENSLASSIDSHVAEPLDKRALRSLIKSAICPPKARARSLREVQQAA
jgi:CheY-like chemotaxis protein